MTPSPQAVAATVRTPARDSLLARTFKTTHLRLRSGLAACIVAGLAASLSVLAIDTAEAQGARRAPVAAAPVVRDHRATPVVRDHRAGVRDHRGGAGSVGGVKVGNGRVRKVDCLGNLC